MACGLPVFRQTAAPVSQKSLLLCLGGGNSILVGVDQLVADLGADQVLNTPAVASTNC